MSVQLTLSPFWSVPSGYPQTRTRFELHPTPLSTPRFASDPVIDVVVVPAQDDTAEVRRRGWWKTILFALFFQPGAVAFSPLSGFKWSEGCELSMQNVSSQTVVSLKPGGSACPGIRSHSSDWRNQSFWSHPSSRRGTHVNAAFSLLP